MEAQPLAIKHKNGHAAGCWWPTVNAPARETASRATRARSSMVMYANPRLGTSQKAAGRKAAREWERSSDLNERQAMEVGRGYEARCAEQVAHRVRDVTRRQMRIVPLGHPRALMS